MKINNKHELGFILAHFYFKKFCQKVLAKNKLSVIIIIVNEI